MSDAEFAELEREQGIPGAAQPPEDSLTFGHDVERCLSGESMDVLCTRVSDCFNLPDTPAGEQASGRAAQANAGYHQLPFAGLPGHHAWHHMV